MESVFDLDVVAALQLSCNSGPASAMLLVELEYGQVFFFGPFTSIDTWINYVSPAFTTLLCEVLLFWHHFCDLMEVLGAFSQW